MSPLVNYRHTSPHIMIGWQLADGKPGCQTHMCSVWLGPFLDASLL